MNPYNTHTNCNAMWWLADDEPLVDLSSIYVEHANAWFSYVVIPQE